MSGIDLNVVENRITNTEEIIKLLESSELTEELITHIKTLRNHLASMELINKDELIKILDSKIVEYESREKENTNNQEALRILKSLNADYQKLGVISTKGEDNDSHKYIDYLTYTSDTGEIEVLSCDSPSTLNEFIQSHADILPTLSAKDVFHYFKEYVHRDLEFQNSEDFKKNEEPRKEAIVNDPEIERQELEDVDFYKQKYGIQEEIKMSVDNNGERLYCLGDGIIKFKTENDRRVMQVLKQPTIKQDNTYDDLLSELDETPTVESNEVTVVTENTRASSDSYGSLEEIQEGDLNRERLIELVSKRDVYDLELSYAEEHELNVYTKYSINCMEKCIKDNSPLGEDAKLAAEIMENSRGEKASIVATYESIQSGTTPPNKLTNIEKEFAVRYLRAKEKVQERGLNNSQNKQRKLEDSHTHPNGVATVVLLLELITLAMFILMFLRLDI